MGIFTQYTPIPWFWSDQFDNKLQIAGLNSEYTNVFHRVDGEKNSFWYFKKNKFISVDAINDPQSYLVGKKLLEINKSPDPNDIISVDTNLKTLLREIK